VSESGAVDLDLPVFQQSDRTVSILTTTVGAERLSERNRLGGPDVRAVADAGRLRPEAILKAIVPPRRRGVILVEGGPSLLGSFLRDRALDELFLTLAPQIAGRDDAVARVSLVVGEHFGRSDARWARLTVVKRVESHLFLRYRFERGTTCKST
jgi:riboflavin biosynthesis pyrimidine reductase